MDVNGIFKELAEYNRIAEETAAVIEGLKDQLRAAIMGRACYHPSSLLNAFTAAGKDRRESGAGARPVSGF